MYNTPVLTYLIIAINVVVSMIMFSKLGSPGGSRMSMAVFSPSEVASGKNYAGMFLAHFSHADGAHLLFNMMTLYFFGPVVEEGLGLFGMLVIYIAAGVLSTIVIFYRHRSDPNYRALGASDSVTGILFAAIVLLPSMSVYFFFVPFPIPAPVFAVAYILLSTYFMQRGRGNISHEAHLAGAAAGLVLAGLMSRNGFEPLIQRIKMLLGS